MTQEALVLDVRDDLRQGREPFGRIMAAVDGLAPGRELVLYATFEPVPLFAVMRSKGFGYESRKLDGGDWEVRFRPL